MDFELTEEQIEVRDLAAATLARRSDPLHISQIETQDSRIDEKLWQDLAESGVTGIGLPEELGGAGLDFGSVVLTLIEQGRAVAPVPLLESVVLGALPIARFGDQDQQQWVARVAAGEAILTGAYEAVTGGWVSPPRASEGANGWQLDGVAVSVPAAHLASAVVVAASVEGESTPRLFLVDLDAAGQSVARADFERSDHAMAADLTFTATAASPLGSAQDDAVAWALDRAWVGMAALQVGMARAEVAQSAAYVTEREQFGMALGLFQAVAHQVADMHIDAEALEVTLWEAAWRIATDREVGESAHVARWWATTAGPRVARAAQHLHGGVGADVTFPIHRYLLWSMTLSATLGNPEYHLQEIGDHLAATDAEVGADAGTSAPTSQPDGAH